MGSLIDVGRQVRLVGRSEGGGRQLGGWMGEGRWVDEWR